MATTTDRMKGKEEHHQGKESMDKAKEAGTRAVDKSKEAAASMGEMATQAASAVGGMATQAATNVGQKVDDMAATAGSGLRQWGDKMGEGGPQEGVLGQASHAVADTIKQGGRYIEESKLSGMAGDAAQLIRRNPMPAFFIGIGIGLLLGRTMRS